MKTIFIKPAPGRLIRDPDTTRPLAQEGRKSPLRRSGVGVLMTAMSFRLKKPLKRLRLYLRMQRLRQKNRSPNRHPIRRNRND